MNTSSTISNTSHTLNVSNAPISNKSNPLNAFRISSPEFQSNTMMSRKYTCQGQDINPPLNISGIPANAKSLALIVVDPDAPMSPWDHWIMWNIPLIKLIAENSVPQDAVVG